MALEHQCINTCESAYAIEDVDAVDEDDEDDDDGDDDEMMALLIRILKITAVIMTVLKRSWPWGETSLKHSTYG